MKQTLKKLLLGTAMTVFLSAVPVTQDAHATSNKSVNIPLTVNETITLEKNVLTLGDIFNGVTKHKNFVLAPAPAPGRDMILNSYDLNQIALSFNLDWQGGNAQDSVKITRDATLITVQDIKQSITDKIVQNHNIGTFRLDVGSRLKDIVLSSRYDTMINVETLDYDARTGRVDAVFRTDDDRTHRVAARLTRITEVPVLSEKMRNGDVITMNDIDWIEMELDKVARNNVVDAEQLIGMTPRRFVNSQTPIRLSDVQAPEVVKKGAAVTMLLDTGKLQLTSKGRALENGAKGDLIRIANSTSNRVIEAIVEDDNLVRVQSGTTIAF